ncbi:alpha,alpha-trehalase TreF [Chitinophaga vietnamensis]|uniref:alpha,alpha-trehalase TreF n=1 Tax=Chitinophaga vietnamensis TaxID=2593957 RepID=UPI00191BEE76|nr:alpha,alpha-trehalase TreF [Chitinophaga vietnamensis]
MKHILLILAIGVTVSIHAQVKTPRTLYPGLFEAVQMAHIYPDGKTFPDMIPKESPERIMQDWKMEKDKPGFNLKAFADAHFELPASHAVDYHSNIAAGVRSHIDTLWTVLRRDPEPSASPSLIPLPEPYIVPGGRFREVYYWDSYFTMLGLKESGHTDLIRSMINNFAWLIHTYGFIPNGNRTYFLTRSQPPFFSMMVRLLGDSLLLHYKTAMLEEYAFWMKGASQLGKRQAVLRVVKLPHGEVLNRYWDNSDLPREESYREDVAAAKTSKQPAAQFYRNIRAAAESGWDFSSRWFSDPMQLSTIKTTDIIPVDLNGLLYQLEMNLSRAYDQAGMQDSATVFRQRASRRKAAVVRYCWNNKAGWYHDYNWRQQRQTRAVTIAGCFPLFFEMSDDDKAARVTAYIRQRMLAPGGVHTTLVSNHQQWDDPNGWAPLEAMTILGLRNYGQVSLADTIAQRWIDLNTAVFNKTGKLMEKYNIRDMHLDAGGGEYPLQDGFGWTNGVLLKLLHLTKQ